MPYDGFNWFECDEDIDEEIVPPTKPGTALFSRIFDFLSSLFLIVFLLSFSTYIFIILFLEDFFDHKSINIRYITGMLLVSTGIFRFLTSTISMISIFYKLYKSKKFVRIYEKIYRLSIILLWALINLSLVFIFGKDDFLYQMCIKPFLLSTIITSGVYIISSLLMINFENHFVKTSLKSKAEETELTEEILNAFKNYAYGIATPSESSMDLPTCKDIFCINFDVSKMSDIFTNDYTNHIYGHHIKVEDPVIFNLNDALALSRDVFYKASKDNEFLSLEDFKLIFQDCKDIEECYTLFDFNHDFNISKKEFRETIVHFYRNRLLLEKTISSVAHFVTAIKRILYSLIFIFLIIIYLVIFGVNIQKLLALAISAAIAFNFLGSKIIFATWKNIMMLLSHQFDVGDEIIVDGKPMTVYEIGLSSTSFILPNGGKLKAVNSDLWSKTIINMSKAPEKKLVFNFEFDGKTDKSKIRQLAHEIKFYLKHRSIDYYDSFVMTNSDNNSNDISKIQASVILKYKNYRTPSKKLFLRIEFTRFLNEALTKILEN